MNDRTAIEQLAATLVQLTEQVTNFYEDAQYDEEIMNALEYVKDALELCNEQFEAVL